MFGKDSRMVPMKRCNKCGVVKPPGEFYKHQHTTDGLRPSCKLCWKAASSKYLKANRAKRNAWFREYRKRPEVKERKNDYYKFKRFRMRMAARRAG